MSGNWQSSTTWCKKLLSEQKKLRYPPFKRERRRGICKWNSKENRLQFKCKYAKILPLSFKRLKSPEYAHIQNLFENNIRILLFPVTIYVLDSTNMKILSISQWQIETFWMTKILLISITCCLTHINSLSFVVVTNC